MLRRRVPSCKERPPKGCSWHVSGGILLFLADAAGWLAPANHYLYDAVAARVANWDSVTDQVCQVELDEEQVRQYPNYLPAVILRLHRMGARGFGVAFPVDATAARKLDALNVPIVTPPLSTATTDPYRNLTPGAQSLLPPRRGVYAHHYVSDRRGRDSLEAVLARRVSARGTIRVTGTYGVHFRGSGGSLPHVQGEQVIEDEVLPDLVRGRVVLLGIQASPHEPRLATPTTNGTDGMRALEFRAHALNSLLTRTAKTGISPLLRFFLLLAATVLAHVVYQSAGLRWAAGITVVVTLLLGGVVGILFAWWHLWIPYASLVAAQFGACILAITYRFNLTETTLQRILHRRVTAKQEESVDRLLTADDPWQCLSQMMYQFVYVNRLIVLERPSDRDHVEAIHAVNCSVNDIQEQRRDSRRDPYRSASEGAEPFLVRGGFFSECRPGENEYLVPMLHAGQVIGFLAISVERDVIASSPELPDQLKRLSEEIAHVTVKRRAFGHLERRRRSLVRRLLLAPEYRAYESIREADRNLQRRRMLLEHAFRDAACPAAIFDVFGENMVMNRAMYRVLQGKGLVTSAATALEALMAIAGMDHVAARQCMRDVVLDGRNTSRLVPDDDGPKLLYLHPVRLNQESGDDASPFGVFGIHMELLDTAPVIPFLEQAGTLTSAPTPALTRPATSTDPSSPAPSLVGADGSSQGPMSAVDPKNARLVEVVPLMKSSLGRLQDRIESHALCIEMVGEHHIGQVHANPFLLSNAFVMLMEFLADNSPDGSTIRVEWDSAAGAVALRMVNEGFGSGGGIHAAATRRPSTELTNIQRIHTMREWFEAWGSRLTVVSSVDKRIEIHLILSSGRPLELRATSGPAGPAPASARPPRPAQESE